jgi:four helix bundle protein
MRAGPGVGANIGEAQGALTHKEFAQGMNVAKKEARESKDWLRLIEDSGLLKDPEVKVGRGKADALARSLTSIVKTAQAQNAGPGVTVSKPVQRVSDRHS